MPGARPFLTTPTSLVQCVCGGGKRAQKPSRALCHGRSPSSPNAFGLCCHMVSPRHPRTCPTAGQGQDTVYTHGTASPHLCPHTHSTSLHTLHSSDHLRASCTPSSTDIQSPLPRDPSWSAHFLPSCMSASGCGQWETRVPSWQCGLALSGHPPRPRAQLRVPPVRGTCSVNTAQVLGSAQIFKCCGWLCAASWASPLSTSSSCLLPALLFVPPASLTAAR